MRDGSTPPIDPMRTEVVRDDNGCAVLALVGALALGFLVAVLDVAGCALGVRFGSGRP
jgi:hypothetical protein